MSRLFIQNFVFYFFGGASLLEIRLYRLVPHFKIHWHLYNKGNIA